MENSNNNVINIFNHMPQEIKKSEIIKTVDDKKYEIDNLTFINDKAKLEYINKRLKEINAEKERIANEVEITDIAKETQNLIDEEAELLIRRSEIESSHPSFFDIDSDIPH